MAPKPRCPTCGSKKWRRDSNSGLIVCEEGHVLPGYLMESNELSHPSTGMTRFQGQGIKRKESKSQRRKPNQRSVYLGQRATYVRWQALQYLLRLQCDALIKTCGFPRELETIIRELWSLILASADPPNTPDDYANGSEAAGSYTGVYYRVLPPRSNGKAPRRKPYPRFAGDYDEVPQDSLAAMRLSDQESASNADSDSEGESSPDTDSEVLFSELESEDGGAGSQNGGASTARTGKPSEGFSSTRHSVDSQIVDESSNADEAFTQSNLNRKHDSSAHPTASKSRTAYASPHAGNSQTRGTTDDVEDGASDDAQIDDGGPPRRFHAHNSTAKVLKHFGVSHLLVVLYLGCLSLRLPIMLNDLIILVRNHDLPFLDCTRFLPPDMCQRMSDATLRSLQVHRIPDVTAPFLRSLVRDLVLFFHKDHNVQFPPTNMPMISWRLCKLYNLGPVGYSTLCRLYSLLPDTLIRKTFDINIAASREKPYQTINIISYVNRTRPPSPEVFSMACLIVVIKLIYGDALFAVYGSQMTMTEGFPAYGSFPPLPEWIQSIRKTNKLRFSQQKESLWRTDVSQMSNDDIDAYLSFCEGALYDKNKNTDATELIEKYFTSDSVDTSLPNPSDIEAQIDSLMQRLYEKPRHLKYAVRVTNERKRKLSSEKRSYSVLIGDRPEGWFANQERTYLHVLLESMADTSGVSPWKLTRLVYRLEHILFSTLINDSPAAFFKNQKRAKSSPVHRVRLLDRRSSSYYSQREKYGAALKHLQHKTTSNAEYERDHRGWLLLILKQLWRKNKTGKDDRIPPSPRNSPILRISSSRLSKQRRRLRIKAARNELEKSHEVRLGGPHLEEPEEVTGTPVEEHTLPSDDTSADRMTSEKEGGGQIVSIESRPPNLHQSVAEVRINKVSKSTSRNPILRRSPPVTRSQKKASSNDHALNLGEKPSGSFLSERETSNHTFTRRKRSRVSASQPPALTTPTDNEANTPTHKSKRKASETESTEEPVPRHAKRITRSTH